MLAPSTIPTLNPASPGSSLIYELLIGLFVICAAIFALVVVLVLIAGVRYRAREGDSAPAQSHGNRALEVAWTSAPLLLLLGILAFTLPIMVRIDPLNLGEGKPDIIVIGHQWWWEVRYPKSGVVTANEVHVPVGRELLVELHSADVIHDFWVPALARKMDMIPGKTNYLHLEADEPGTYRGFCAEYCGLQHAHMHFLVIAQPAAELEAWLRDQQQTPPQPQPGSEAAAGQKLLLDKTCASCHRIAGTPARAAVGPDLTHVGSRRTLIGAYLTNTRANLQRWLREPQRLKPGAHMPNVRLTPDQARQIATYLESLR